MGCLAKEVILGFLEMIKYNILKFYLLNKAKRVITDLR